MQILLGRGAQRLQAEIVAAQQRHSSELLELPLAVDDGPGCVEAGEQLGSGGKDHVLPLAHLAVSEDLRQVALISAAGARDQHGAFSWM